MVFSVTYYSELHSAMIIINFYPAPYSFQRLHYPHMFNLSVHHTNLGGNWK